MKFKMIVFLFFSFSCIHASDFLQPQKIQNLKSVISRTTNYVEHSQLPLSSDDYIHQSVQISDALLQAGHEIGCSTSCMYSVVTCATTCLPTYAAKMRYRYTLHTAQQYIKKFHDTHQDTTVYLQLRSSDEGGKF